MTTEKDWRYLMTKEMSEILLVSTQTIRQWRIKKGLPAKKFSSKRLEFYIFDVIDWMCQQEKIDNRRFWVYHPYMVALLQYVNKKEAKIYHEGSAERTEDQN